MSNAPNQADDPDRDLIRWLWAADQQPDPPDDSPRPTTPIGRDDATGTAQQRLAARVRRRSKKRPKRRPNRSA